MGGDSGYIYGVRTQVREASAVRKSLRKVEKHIRGLDIENTWAIDTKGKAVKVSYGETKDRAFINGKLIPKNAILTHNHPQLLKEYGNGIAARIGNSFSWDDIEKAVKYNVREIRAVTPTYTYSIRRPANGWGITHDKVAKVYTSKLKGRATSAANYYKSAPTTERWARANVVLSHQVVKDMARRYGWKYTKRRSS